MKRYILLAILFFTGFSNLKSQSLYQVMFNNGETLRAFSFITDQGIIIRITEDGKLIQWGVEPELRGIYYTPGKLDQYMGRVDYFGNEGDSVSKGKVKSIGTAMISYYGGYEQDYKIGKIKSIGAVQFDYYSNYDNAAFRGKLRSANNQQFTYYGSIENEMVRGKLKAVNNTPIVYHLSYEEKQVRGKVKTIGTYRFNWFYDRPNINGTNQQTASFNQNINGITYLLFSY